MGKAKSSTIPQSPPLWQVICLPQNKPFPVMAGLWHCFAMFYPHSFVLLTLWSSSSTFNGYLSAPTVCPKQWRCTKRTAMFYSQPWYLGFFETFWGKENTYCTNILNIFVQLRLYILGTPGTPSIKPEFEETMFRSQSFQFSWLKPHLLLSKSLCLIPKPIPPSSHEISQDSPFKTPRIKTYQNLW